MLKEGAGIGQTAGFDNVQQKRWTHAQGVPKQAEPCMCDLSTRLLSHAFTEH